MKTNDQVVLGQKYVQSVKWTTVWLIQHQKQSLRIYSKLPFGQKYLQWSVINIYVIVWLT